MQALEVDRTLPERLRDPQLRPQALRDVGEWTIHTVLLFGGEITTAYICAAEMVRGLARDLEKHDRPNSP